MTSGPSHWTYRPRITFQDTNVVGNVYFLTYFRWQFECFEEWRRQQRCGGQQPGKPVSLRAVRCSTSFSDPVGATVGDRVDVISEFERTAAAGHSASSTIRRHADDFESVLAKGTITFEDHDRTAAVNPERPVGPCYAFGRRDAQHPADHPLDLLSLQGKCRELFLLDHAPETIRRVVDQELALQTTSASVEILKPRPLESEELKVELRLEALKCGQVTVRFDYFEIGDDRSVHFARGQQRMSCKRRGDRGLLPTPLPADILRALRRFTDDGHLLEKIAEIERFSESMPEPSSSERFP